MGDLSKYARFSLKRLSDLPDQAAPNRLPEIHLQGDADGLEYLAVQDVGIVMKYFDESSDKYQRIGKVIGDAFTATIMLTFIVIFTISLLDK